MSHLVMYVVLRLDLVTKLNWPVGALVTQACHAGTALIWTFRNDPLVEEYMKEMDSMRKVVLAAEDEATLKSVGETLEKNGIDHKLWVEQPENIPVCVAVKPYPKETVHPHLKHLKLFK